MHGQSVGSRMIDFVPATTTSQLRWRCLQAMAPSVNAHVRSFSAHFGHAPTP